MGSGLSLILAMLRKMWAVEDAPAVRYFHDAEARETVKGIEQFMFNEIDEVTPERLAQYRRLSTVAAAMNILSVELEAPHAPRGGTFESVLQAVETGEEPVGMSNDFHVEGESNGTAGGAA